MFHFVRSRSGAAVAALVLLVACTERVRLGRDLAPAAGSGGAAGTGGAAPGGAGVEFPLGGAGEVPAEGDAAVPPVGFDAGPCTPSACGGSVRACGNCADDDGDGWADASDPECLGPCDDSERELDSGSVTNITGSCRADCYFDRNTGSGDDGCSWSFRCDPGSLAPDFFPTGSSMCEHDPELASCADGSTLAACQDGCLPLTPNGCDCFGCCELPASSGRFIWLGATDETRRCTVEGSSDPSLCPPCTPVPDCQNRCEECELCVGKPALPAACSANPGPSCPSGVSACDPRSPADCGLFAYCITGCCVPLPR